MKHLRQMLALLLCLFLVPMTAQAEGEKLPLQDAHRVKMKQVSKSQSNGSTVYRWQIEKTAQPSVTEEINALALAYADELAPTLGRPAKDSYSRLDVDVLHSRTGLSWMSFMVQSRYILNKVVKDVRFTTRTYDMATGERLMLTDIFPADSEVWPILQEAVKERINAYFPGTEPVQEAYEAAITREAVEQMDFTLHGMSLMLHLHAGDFYPGKQQLIQVTLFYPEVRPYMTEKAQAETDNLKYYNTIALTYDDGPNGWVTREMLNVLLKSGERATFFVVGERLKSHSVHVQREHDQGHSVATHNYEHVYANQVKAEKLLSMVDKVNAVHEEIIGIAPTYARAPGGIWEPMAKAQLGWPLLHWTLEARDWEGENGRDPNKVRASIVAQAADGAIILMHDMQPNSVEASEMFIADLQEKGFLFLTIDELFAKDGVTLEPDTLYWRCVNGVTTIN